jgi:hypothetical protein
VGAYQIEVRDGERLMREGQHLVDLMVQSGAGVRAEVAKVSQSLQGQGIGTQWIEAELARLSAVAESLAVAAVTESVDAHTTELGNGLSALGERAARAQTLAREQNRIVERIARAHEEVGAARQEISERTGVAPDKLLNEKGWKVDNKLYHAQQRVEQAARLIGDADLDAAEAQLEQARKFGQQVAEVVEISLAAAREYRSAVASLGASAERLGQLVPKRRTILEPSSMSPRFASRTVTRGARRRGTGGVSARI